MAGLKSLAILAVIQAVMPAALPASMLYTTPPTSNSQATASYGNLFASTGTVGTKLAFAQASFTDSVTIFGDSGTGTLIFQAAYRYMWGVSGMGSGDVT